MTRTLPTWNPEWSDGASLYQLPVLPWTVGRWLERHGVDRCHRVFSGPGGHDHAYYLGGPALDRRKADRRLRNDLLELRVPPLLASLVYAGVRAGGVPWLRWDGVSWGFGGRCFRYTDGPAVETTSTDPPPGIAPERDRDCAASRERLVR